MPKQKAFDDSALCRYTCFIYGQCSLRCCHTIVSCIGDAQNGSLDNPWWEELVNTTDGRKIYEKGFANVPLDAPGFGIELNDDVVKQHLNPTNKTYFIPTPEWDSSNSNDFLWSGRTTGGTELLRTTK